MWEPVSAGDSVHSTGREPSTPPMAPIASTKFKALDASSVLVPPVKYDATNTLGVSETQETSAYAEPIDSSEKESKCKSECTKYSMKYCNTCNKNCKVATISVKNCVLLPEN